MRYALIHSLAASTALAGYCNMSDPAPAEVTQPPATPAAPAPKAAKPKTILDDMASRHIVKDVDALNAYIGVLVGYQGIEEVQWATPGVTQDEESAAFILDPAIYAPGVEIAVELMTEKGSAKDNVASKPKCIIIRPNPSLDLLLADDKAREWLAKIAAKEMNLVATRPLRKVAKVDEAVGAMPTTLGDYITGRDLGGSMLESYNEQWETIKKTLAKSSKAFAMAGLSKKTMRQGMESKAFAAQTFPLLEDRGEAESWFVIASKLGAALATKAGQSPEIFTKWLETRDSYEIETTEEEGEFDLAAALAAIAADPAPAVTEATASEAPTA